MSEAKLAQRVDDDGQFVQGQSNPKEKRKVSLSEMKWKDRTGEKNYRKRKKDGCAHNNNNNNTICLDDEGEDPCLSSDSFVQTRRRIFVRLELFFFS